MWLMAKSSPLFYSPFSKLLRKKKKREYISCPVKPQKNYKLFGLLETRTRQGVLWLWGHKQNVTKPTQSQQISSEGASSGTPCAVQFIQVWHAWPLDTGTRGWPLVQDSLRVLGSQAGSSCSVSCCRASPQEAGSQEKQDPSHGQQKQAHLVHFSYSTLSQIPLTVCRWPSASECRTCCS